MSVATRNQVWDALPPVRFGVGRPLELDLDASTERQVMARLFSRDFDDWSEAISRVGFCANPIRLVGRSETFDTRTGDLVRSYGSAEEALGVTFTRCGNRRADRCESCSRLYAADTFQLIRAGIAGGKTVPQTVADNPLVFATLTSPSFGPVHGTRPNGGRCRPRRNTGHRCPTGATPRAGPCTPTTTRTWGSPSARTATTTPRRLCGSGGRRSCGGGSPSPCAASWRTTSAAPRDASAR